MDSQKAQKKMVQLTDLDSIHQLLFQLTEEERPIYIWQKDQQDMRNKGEVLVEKIIKGVDKDDIRLILKSNDLTNSFDPQLNIYIYCAHKTIIFKTEITQTNEDYLELAIPLDVRLEEQRMDKRIPIEKELAKGKAVVTKHGTDLTSSSKYIVKPFDISRNGISLLFRKTQASSIQIGERLKLWEIFHKNVRPVIELKVMHKSAFQSEGYDDFVKIGLQCRGSNNFHEILLSHQID